MEQNTHKRFSLKQKLKKAVSDIHIDVFGYEKNVTRNVVAYFDKLSKETGLPSDQIIVRMFKQQHTVKTCVHQKGKVVKDISVQELIELFTGTMGMPGMEEKMTDRIIGLITDLMRQHKQEHHQFHVCILAQNGQVSVHAVNGNTVLETIPLTVLIQYFTR
ncbi:hypothetical protein [Aquimarina algicola]|uniref:Uncharacterized protein n=1 Tax=Aquimarina algicola TaxID=2589995 RepID=A0A504J4U1_9FLAO|nr:hypothetical protein [Aquimarina algicola]TPN85827.1 hypothetical protein FHK87_11095 [Aquimarina algicola]